MKVSPEYVPGAAADDLGPSSLRGAGLGSGPGSIRGAGLTGSPPRAIRGGTQTVEPEMLEFMLELKQHVTVRRTSSFPLNSSLN